FAGLLALDLLLGLSPVLSAWIVKLVFDSLPGQLQGQAAQPFWAELAPLLALQIAVELLIQAGGPVKTYLSGELERRLELNIQQTIYRKINGLAGLAPFEDPRFQDLLRFAHQGAHQGPNQLLGTLTTLQGNLITLVSFMAVLLIFSPTLAAIVALAIAPQLYIQLRLSRQRFDMAMNTSPKERLAAYYSHVLSTVHFAKEIRLFNLGEYFLGAFARTTREVQQARRRQQAREMGWLAAMNGLTSLAARGAFVLVVAAAFAGRLSVGDITLYVSAVANVQSAFSGLVFALASLSESLLFFSRFTELMALEQPIPVASPARPAPPLRQGIELRNVSFRYSAEHPWILREVNAFLPAGGCVALVGLNGAGKTTLVKLLTRMYDPCDGAILWDGVDLRELDPASLRERIGAIFQDFAHYDLPAYQNIGLGDSRRIDDRASIVRAARRSGIHPALERLPEGYETPLSRWLGGEGQGAELSGGEWQKLALARMFMREGDFLILDEPTAALDAEAEAEIYQRFTQLIRGSTSLLISHRLSAVRMADLIIVLEDGRIAECGSHAALCAQNRGYARLYALQAEPYQASAAVPA
ncbi:MAG TPA: ABC transporter ATP-binding protein, partial [Herpetosiphonaceae bacterium]|nr:ABC transporter ATP-binding protein [Herpetosiphonaceae bacterium]